MQNNPMDNGDETKNEKYSRSILLTSQQQTDPLIIETTAALNNPPNIQRYHSMQNPSILTTFKPANESVDGNQLHTALTATKNLASFLENTIAEYVGKYSVKTAPSLNFQTSKMVKHETVRLKKRGAANKNKVVYQGKDFQITKYDDVSDNAIDIKLKNSSYGNSSDILSQYEGTKRDTDKINQLMMELNNESMEQSKRKSFSENYKVAMSQIDICLEQHFRELAIKVLDEFHINHNEWLDILHNFMIQAVKSIKPSSRLLNDSIDINDYIKIFYVQWKNQDKCQYVDGVVLDKNVAHRQMISEISKPRILLLSNSLGYVKEDEIFMDLESVIRLEEPYVQIILTKIEKVSPSLIFVEKDVSRLALDKLLHKNITIVTNVKPSVMKQLARCTQTIVCPSTNLLEEGFVTGTCANYRIEKIIDRKREGGQIQANEQILMFLEGCQPFLGCTIILSGPSREELKNVKKAFRKMISIARTLILEKEYFTFIQASMKNEESSDFIFINKETSPFLFKKHLERDQLVFEKLQFCKTHLNDEVDLDQLENPQHFLKEWRVKRKLNVMCQSPQKLVIKFLDPKSDITLGQKILELVRNSNILCNESSCKQPQIKHITCYYHNTGCVEMRLKLDKNSIGELFGFSPDLNDTQRIYLQVYCNKCQSIIIPKAKISSQLYEMSFYRFLEQYFYNQDLNKIAYGDAKCDHYIHKFFSLSFKIGPMRVIFNYQMHDVYSLDLVHYQSLNNTIVSLILINSKIFVKKLAQSNNEFKEEVLTEIIENKFYTVLQLNRVEYLIATKIAHFIVIIRELCNILENDLQQHLNKRPLTSGPVNTAPEGLRKISYEDILFNHKANIGKERMNNSMVGQDTYRQAQVMKPFNVKNKQGFEKAVASRMSQTVIQQNFTMVTKSKPNDQLSFDFDILEHESFQNLFKSSPSYQFGVNKDFIKLEQEDLSSILAYTLSSNLYIEGLIKINYIDISNRISLQSTQQSSGQKQNPLTVLKAQQDGIIPAKNDVIRISLKNDVLNYKTRKQEIENELLSFDTVVFTFHFNNYGRPSANHRLIITKNGAIISEIKNGRQVHTETQNNETQKRQKSPSKGNFESIRMEKDFPIEYYTEISELKQEITILKGGTKSPSKIHQSARTELNIKQPLEASKILQNEIYDISSQFWGKTDYIVKVYFPGQFQALRKLYVGSHESCVHSLFQSKFWAENTGGKSKASFFKSHDEKFVFKVIKSSELKTFKDSGLNYFDYLCKSFFHAYPTALAKILGAYKVKIRDQASGKWSRYCFFMMENILINVKESDSIRKYDLKGSQKNRFVIQKQKGQVLLDINFLLDQQSKPIVLNYGMYELLRASIRNDSFFLSKNNIIDYSLFAIIDTEKKLLRVGIIDYIQQYTFDKILESQFKKVINVGVKPTIIETDQYKKRFREALSKYFIPIYSDEELKSYHDIINAVQKDSLMQQKDGGGGGGEDDTYLSIKQSFSQAANGGMSMKS